MLKLNKMKEAIEKMVDAIKKPISKLKSKRDLEVIEKIVNEFKKDIHTTSDIENAASLFFVRKDNTIQEARIDAYSMKSSLGEMVIDSNMRKSIEENNKIKYIIKAFFAKGKKYDNGEEDKFDRNNLEEVRKEFESADEFMVVEVYDEKCLHLNAYEYITAEDKAEKKTYVCISPTKTIEESISYKGNDHLTNYFKDER